MEIFGFILVMWYLLVAAAHARMLEDKTERDFIGRVYLSVIWPIADVILGLNQLFRGRKD